MTEIEKIQAELEYARQRLRTVNGRLAVLGHQIGPLRRAVNALRKQLWARCWTVHSPEGETARDYDTGLEWADQRIVQGVTWQHLGAQAYADFDAATAPFKAELEPLLREEGVFKLERREAQRDIESAERRLKIKANATRGSKPEGPIFSQMSLF